MSGIKETSENFDSNENDLYSDLIMGKPVKIQTVSDIESASNDGITSSNPSLKSTGKSSATNKSASVTKSAKSSQSFDTVLKYIIFSVIIILIVSLVIYICRKVYTSRIDNIAALLEASRKEEAILNSKVKSLEEEKQSYVQRIYDLNNEIQIQQAAPFASTLPMTKNSYDAPDPDQPREKPKLIKDKEKIKAFVNSKRTTVQDELDEKESLEKEEQNRNDDNIQKNLQIETHTNDDDDDETVPKGSENDEKVDEIMSIIQS